MVTEDSPRVYDGSISAEGKKFAIIVSRFNQSITDRLLEGALVCLKKNGSDLESDVEVFYCPGAFELPQVASVLAKKKKINAIICLGAVIKGETPHFDYICQEVSRGIGEVSRNNGLPVLFGVLTTNTFEQALERAGGSVGNKGFDAALGAITMANLFSQID